MPVCHLTLHGYGTWWPDHPRGYTTEENGVLPPDPDMADAYRRQAKFDAVNFDEPAQRVLIRGGWDICQRRQWRCHAIGTDATHVHYVLSDRNYIDFDAILAKMKNVLSLFLGRLTKTQGRPWFVAGGSTKPVKDGEHFAYLVNSYLPSHRGLFWKEGDVLPTVPDGIL